MFRGARNLSYVSLFTGMLLAFVAFLLFVNRATERVVPCFHKPCVYMQCSARHATYVSDWSMLGRIWRS